MHSADDAVVLLGQLGFVLAVGTFIGCQPAIMVEAVPAEVRCTAIAVGYNVTLGVVGGLSPLVATWLVERTANDLQPGLHDHGGRGRLLPGAALLQGNFRGAAERHASRATPGVREPPREPVRRAQPSVRCRSRCAGG